MSMRYEQDESAKETHGILGHAISGERKVGV
jgi:hypothetical protein